MQITKSHRCFGGQVEYWEHPSQVTKTPMRFATFRPQGTIRGCLIWLSGLTCNEDNFVTKAGAQPLLADAGLMLVCPDTSPRGLNLPGEHDGWDFGAGAGFYVNATTPHYREHYQMYDYVTQELYDIITDRFGMSGRISIFGHSMGGHGALVMGLKEKDKFRSISAFAPICNPINAPWGQKAFRGYLGDLEENWRPYDSCALLEAGRTHGHMILVDQGLNDPFLVDRQLLPEHLEKACKKAGQPLNMRYHEGYDHSYFGIATFIGEHIAFHGAALA
jgi:S-formylglutathione hydrolase